MNALAAGSHAFLERAGWNDAAVEPLAGDASFRRYFRLRRASSLGGETAMLMHAPPPEEDARPFLDVARWLSEHGQRAPAIIAADAKAGWVLTEDFGDARMRDWLDANPGGERRAYEEAVDALVRLHAVSAGPFAPYDMPTYLREAALYVEWFCPVRGLEVDCASYEAAWRAALEPAVARQHPPVTVLRDYHAENIMLLDPSPDGSGPQGLIDFQDALQGHRAYDLVSLLQDARRHVSPELERAMFDRYVAAAAPGVGFAADYHVLGAQRNAKIVGIFTRLARRDGKPRYLAMISHVAAMLERDLAHPALAPVRAWFDANVPAEARA